MKRVMSLLGAVVLSFVTTCAQGQDRAALGISMSDQSGDNGAGALVTNVSVASPAAQAGLVPGDRIVAIDGQSVSSYNDVQRIVSASAPGSRLSVDVLRGTMRISVTAALSSAAQVFPASYASVKTSAWGYPLQQCDASGCVQVYYPPHNHRHFNQPYSCGRSYCGGYGYGHHGCQGGCR